MNEKEMDKLPLSQLCKPLSAKVMSAAAVARMTGQQLTPERALDVQRRQGRRIGSKVAVRE